VNVTVDILEKDIKDILRFSGEKKKGPAIVKLVASQLMLYRRRELSEEVMAGRFSVALPDWRDTRQRERGEAPGPVNGDMGVDRCDDLRTPPNGAGVL
jgi:hypothetical protein